MAELLRSALLVAHLLANAAACGAPAVAGAFALWRPLREACPLVLRRLVLAGVGAMLLGAVLGGASVAAILATGDDAYAAAFARVPPFDVAMLVSEWFFTLVLYAVMAWMAWRGVLRPRLFAFVALVAVTNLAYHFPTMMSVLGDEAAAPTLVGEEALDRAAFRERVVAPPMIARTLWFWALSLLAGAALLSMATREEQQSAGGRAITTAAAWTGLIGLSLVLKTSAVLLAVSPPTRDAVLGGDAVATALALAAATGMAVAASALLRVAFGRATALPVRSLLFTVAAVAWALG